MSKTQKREKERQRMPKPVMSMVGDKLRTPEGRRKLHQRVIPDKRLKVRLKGLEGDRRKVLVRSSEVPSDFTRGRRTPHAPSFEPPNVRFEHVHYT